MKKSKKEKNASSIGGLIFVACLFLGGGLGSMLGNVSVGSMIGMGIGFLAMAGIWLYYRAK
jgi:hypothetical protein